MADDLRTLLKEAKPGWSAQDNSDLSDSQTFLADPAGHLPIISPKYPKDPQSIPKSSMRPGPVGGPTQADQNWYPKCQGTLNQSEWKWSERRMKESSDNSPTSKNTHGQCKADHKAIGIPKRPFKIQPHWAIYSIVIVVTFHWFLLLLHDSSGLSEELSESFSQLNELLSAAGFLKFSNDTLEELKLRLPSKVEGQKVFSGRNGCIWCMWGFGWTMEGGGALSGIDEAVQRLQNMKDDDAWMTRAAGAKMLCTCQSCYSSKTFCQQHFRIFWIPSLCALVKGFITHRYPRFLYVICSLCSIYQIIRLWRRWCGKAFGVFHPWRIARWASGAQVLIESSSITSQTWQTWRLAVSQNAFGAAPWNNNCVPWKNMKKHERLGIIWACGIMLKCLDSVGFYVLRSN